MKGTLLGREQMTSEEVEVEMLSTVMSGNAEEGRKRLIGLVFAEERFLPSSVLCLLQLVNSTVF